MPENRVQMNTADDKDEQSRTIMGRSRFSTMFRRAFDEATKAVTEEEETSEENLYYSPGIIQTLFNTYMAIFPMWSGVMLGDLKRHAADKVITSVEDGGQRQDNKTRETNCHVEGWFAIVKKHILIRQLCTQNVLFFAMKIHRAHNAAWLFSKTSPKTSEFKGY